MSVCWSLGRSIFSKDWEATPQSLLEHLFIGWFVRFPELGWFAKIASQHSRWNISGQVRFLENLIWGKELENLSLFKGIKTINSKSNQDFLILKSNPEDFQRIKTIMNLINGIFLILIIPSPLTAPIDKGADTDWSVERVAVPGGQAGDGQVQPGHVPVHRLLCDTDISWYKDHFKAKVKIIKFYKEGENPSPRKAQ